jgi:ankyrin repeat protein
LRQQLKRLENCAYRGDGWLTMKSQLIAIVAAVLLAGCGDFLDELENDGLPPLFDETGSSNPVSSNPVADKYLLESAAKGDIDDVKIQLGNGANVDAKDSIGRTPLHIAAGSGLLGTPVQGNKEIADLLIEEGADVDAKNKWGDTPLHVAVEGGNKEIVEMLIESNADYDLWDQQGETPLDKAKIDHDDNNRDSYNAAGETVIRRDFSQFEAAINEIADLLHEHGAKTGKEIAAERREESLPFP